MTQPPEIHGVANHADAVRSALSREEWFSTQFAVYRCTVEYPLLHSMVYMEISGTR